MCTGKADALPSFTAGRRLGHELREPGACQAAHRTPLHLTGAPHPTGAPTAVSAMKGRSRRDAGAPGGPGPRGRRTRNAAQEPTRAGRPARNARRAPPRRVPARRARDFGGEGAGGAGRRARHRDPGGGRDAGLGEAPGPGRGPRTHRSRRQAVHVGSVSRRRPPPDAPDPRPFSSDAAKEDEPPQPPSAWGSPRPFAAL